MDESVTLQQLRQARDAACPPLVKPAGASTRWATRKRPKVDRIACPWLIARFIDRDAEFLYVPPGDVLRVAQEQRAVPYDALYLSCRDGADAMHARNAGTWRVPLDS